MARKFYWIKLKANFMTSDAVDFLMSQKDGANYIVLYQMLCFMTIQSDGKLQRQLGEIIIPYDEEKIQRDTKFFSIDTIRIALNLYQKLGLIYRDENGILAISGYDEMVGSESQSAKWVRDFRERKALELKEKTLQCNEKVITTPLQCKVKCNTDKEKELKLEYKYIYTPTLKVGDERKSQEENQILNLIQFFNETCKTNYRKDNKKFNSTLKSLLKRFNEDEIKQVIIKKSQEWLNTEWQKYLRPETLFGNKFESYLNSNIKENRKIITMEYEKGSDDFDFNSLNK